MKRTATFSAAALTLALALAPGLALARPGEGGSMGSRGSRTWSAPAPTRTTPYGAAPMERSIAPRQAPTYGAGVPYGARPMAPFGQARNGHPFLTGFAGGLLGAGIFGMLSGHGFMGGIHGFFSLIGFLIQIALIVFVISWLIRKFSGNSGGQQNNSSGFSPVGTGGGTTAPVQSSVQLSAQDYQAFQKLLLSIQSAWSDQNILALQGMATPEMVSYFNQQLAALASRGERNVVSDVHFIQGDLSEAWRENGADYATVAMRYSLVDMTTDMTGRVINGSSAEPVTVTEMWTFVRPSSGGSWLLSAIQQAR